MADSTVQASRARSYVRWARPFPTVFVWMRRRDRLSLVSPNRRSPAPTATGKTVRRSSSTRSCSISVRTSGRLAYTTISPCICCLSFETSLTTSPARTVAFVHLGSWSVADTTYLGRRFKLSSHSPLIIDDRAPKYSSLRRPISSASAPCASASSSSAHASQSWPMNWTNQPPCLNPPSPLGSSTTPSSVTFWLTTIFPILILLASGARPGLGPPPTGQTPGTAVNWARRHRPIRHAGGVFIVDRAERAPRKEQKARMHADADGHDG